MDEVENGGLIPITQSQLTTTTLFSLIMLLVPMAVASQSAANVPEPTDLRQPARIAHLFAEVPPETAADATHQAPELPFIVNGVLYQPEDVELFQGQSLHFFADPEIVESGMLRAFRTKKAMWEFVAREQKLPASHPIMQFHNCLAQATLLQCQKAQDDHLVAGDGGGGGGGGGTTNEPSLSGSGSSSGFMVFYEHHDWEGAGFVVPVGFAANFVPPIGWWNDRLSSSDAEGSVGGFTLYDSINFSGSTLTLTGIDTTQETFHSTFGWGDRADSLQVF